MEFTNEQLAKARAAKSAAELMELAKAENIELTGREAKYIFDVAHAEGNAELSESELENVSGGAILTACYTGGARPLFSIGDRVRVWVDYRTETGWDNGTVAAVSDKKSSTLGICKEWRYSVQLDKCGLFTDLYEHELETI